MLRTLEQFRIDEKLEVFIPNFAFCLAEDKMNDAPPDGVVGPNFTVDAE